MKTVRPINIGRIMTHITRNVKISMKKSYPVGVFKRNITTTMTLPGHAIPEPQVPSRLCHNFTTTEERCAHNSNKKRGTHSSKKKNLSG